MATTSTTDNLGAQDVGRRAPRPVAPFAVGPVLGIAAVAAASMLAFATRYGYHRDELYFIAAGQRLEGGYVDQPPLTPIVARAADVVFGHSLLGLRAVTALLVALGVVAVGLLARELGGGRIAQILAAFTVAASPLLRAHNSFLGTTGLDQLMWAATFLATARMLRTNNPRYWIAVGAALGLGLETKATIIVLAVALVVGVVVDRRWVLLRSGWFAAGVVAAFAIWAPNLLWNASNEWAMVTFSEGKHSHIGDVVMYAYFVFGQILTAGITTAFVWVPGWRWLFARTPASAPFRPLGIAAAVVTGVFFVMGAKYYYGAPVYLVLFAAGAVALEAGVRRTRIVATWMVALSIVLCAPMTMPLLPAGEADAVAAVNRTYSSMVGWPEMASQVQSIVASLPPEEQEQAVVFAVNYGEAGAIEHFAPELDVYSGHNAYWGWGPPPDAATTAVLVGFGNVVPTVYCDAPERVGTVANDAGLENFESGQPIWLCRELSRPWSELWPGQQQYT
jgi:hypothetical protein